MIELSLLATTLASLTGCLARSVGPNRRQSYGQFINTTQYNSTSSAVEGSISLTGEGRNKTAPLR